MSRRSQAFAEGPSTFSWKFERLADDQGRERMKCSCVTHPDVAGWGDDEQSAMWAAKSAMANAVEKAEL